MDRKLQEYIIKIEDTLEEIDSDPDPYGLNKQRRRLLEEIKKAVLDHDASKPKQKQ